MMPRYVNRHDDKGTLPFEVVDLISASVLLIREMSCDRVKGWKPAMIMGQCVNESDQRWEIIPDPEALTFRIRLDKRGDWKDTSGKVYVLAENPVRFHRFSFLGGVYNVDGDE
jgi:hypothetical protein